MKKNLLFIGLAVSLIAVQRLSAQGAYNCGNVEAHQKLYAQHPELIQAETDYNTAITAAVETKKTQKTAEVVHIIPIVFHIVHTNGPENISDAQIIDQVSILNRDYRKLNADTSLLVAGYDTLSADINVEFRLAQIDPNGNCTNGIDRIYSHRTNAADDNSKLNGWPREHYLNVWVVKTIGSAGVAGYAYYPSAVNGFGAPIDGVLILNDYIGSIGTSIPSHSRALTHEIGHWMDLQHPWGNTNDPGVACGDDLVNDTPITKGHTSCMLTDATCTPGLIENTQNYMDYSYCSVMFTLGQKARMRAALENSVSFRSSLWINSNLAATGTDGSGTVCTPVVDFSANKYMICPGASVTFTKNVMNITAGTATTYSWLFPGGTPASFTGATPPAIVYSTPGAYDVTLTATNVGGAGTATKTMMINVSQSYAMVPRTYSEGFENTSNFYDNWKVNDMDHNGRTWWLNSATGYTGSHSIKMDTYYNYAYDVDQLFSPSYDLSFMMSGTVLTFRCAAATKATTAADLNDNLKVYVSKDCGASWFSIKTLTGAAFINNSYHPEEFIPTNASQWDLQTVNIPITYLTGNTRFKFEYTSGLAGNSIYLDDINISGTTGINDLSEETDNVSIFPNPTNQTATVNYSVTSTANTKVELVDVLGKKIMEVSNLNQTQGDYSIQISKNNLNLKNGIYFVKITIGSSTITKKLIVTE